MPDTPRQLVINTTPLIANSISQFQHSVPLSFIPKRRKKQADPGSVAR
jgi:hypothetical protein